MNTFFANAITALAREEQDVIVSAIMEKIPDHIKNGQEVTIKGVINAMIMVAEEVLIRSFVKG